MNDIPPSKGITHEEEHEMREPQKFTNTKETGYEYQCEKQLTNEMQVSREMLQMLSIKSPHLSMLDFMGGHLAYEIDIASLLEDSNPTTLL